MNDVGRVWADILGENRLEPGWHWRRLDSASRNNIHAAVRQPDGLPAVLIEVPTADVPADFEPPVSRGFQAWPEPVRPGPNGTTRLCLMLSEPAYHAVFAVLCDDIARTVEAAETPNDVIRVWARRLHMWMAFMRRFEPGGLSDSIVLGLLAELHALCVIVMPAVDAAAAVAAWRGPEGAAHDFVLAQCDLEVKGIRQNPPRRVEIANLEQLYERSGHDLVLGVFVLVEDDGGASLPQVVAAVRAILAEHAPQSLPTFDDRLLLLGYTDAQADLYRTAYSVRQSVFYRIGDGFPRLVPGDAPTGVECVRYVLDLAAAAPFRETGESVVARLSAGEGSRGA